MFGDKSGEEEPKGRLKKVWSDRQEEKRGRVCTALRPRWVSTKSWSLSLAMWRTPLGEMVRFKAEGKWESSFMSFFGLDTSQDGIRHCLQTSCCCDTRGLAVSHLRKEERRKFTQSSLPVSTSQPCILSPSWVISVLAIASAIGFRQRWEKRKWHSRAILVPKRIVASKSHACALCIFDTSKAGRRMGLGLQAPLLLGKDWGNVEPSPSPPSGNKAPLWRHHLQNYHGHRTRCHQERHVAPRAGPISQLQCQIGQKASH